MKRVLIMVLCAILLASCATHESQMVDYRIDQSLRGVRDGSKLTEADLALRRINAERMNNYRPAAQESSVPPAPPPPMPGVIGWDVLGALVAIPLLVPIAMIANYPSYLSGYHGVHCRSYTYKDQYHTKCY